MPSGKSGISFEHSIANGVYRRTGNRLLPQRDGYSGNGAVPSADIVIEDGETVHAIELKNTSRNSQTFEYDPEPDVLSDDIAQLFEFMEQYPRTVCGYLGVKFPNRQLILAKVWADGATPLEDIVATCPVDAVVTRADNVSIRKPPTTVQAKADETGWPSAQAGNDIDYLLNTIGYDKPVVDID